MTGRSGPPRPTDDDPSRNPQAPEARGIAALTGGTGFVGRHIVSALLRAGWRVRVLARRPQAAERLAGGIDIVPGSLEDEAALERLIVGADVLVHAAGTIKAARRADFFRTNQDGSRRVAAIAARQKVPPRVVVVSSLAARVPRLSPYARSKRAGEEEFTASGLGSVAILRPAAVYGPGDRETAVFFTMAKGPLLCVPGATDARVGLVHVVDVAAAVTAFCAKDAPRGTFELTDEHCQGYSWRELAEEIRTAAHGRARIAGLPFFLFAFIGSINVFCAALGFPPQILTPAKARELFHRDWSSVPAHRPPVEIWQPHIGLREGMIQTAHWLALAGCAEKRRHRYAV